MLKSGKQGLRGLIENAFSNGVFLRVNNCIAVENKRQDVTFSSEKLMFLFPTGIFRKNELGSKESGAGLGIWKLI